MFAGVSLLARVMLIAIVALTASVVTVGAHSGFNKGTLPKATGVHQILGHHQEDKGSISNSDSDDEEECIRDSDLDREDDFDEDCESVEFD